MPIWHRAAGQGHVRVNAGGRRQCYKRCLANPEFQCRCVVLQVQATFGWTQAVNCSIGVPINFVVFQPHLTICLYAIPPQVQATFGSTQEGNGSMEHGYILFYEKAADQ